MLSAGYVVHPVDSTNEGVIFYLDADAPKYPYVIDLTDVAGVAMMVWVHDFVSLTKLSQSWATSRLYWPSPSVITKSLIPKTIWVLLARQIKRMGVGSTEAYFLLDVQL